MPAVPWRDTVCSVGLGFIVRNCCENVGELGERGEGNAACEVAATGAGAAAERLSVRRVCRQDGFAGGDVALQR